MATRSSLKMSFLMLLVLLKAAYFLPCLSGSALVWAAGGASIKAFTPEEITDVFTCKGKKALDKQGGLARMQQVQDAYKKLSGLHAQFTQTSYLAALDVAEKSSGEVWFSQPGKMRWHYSKPEKQDFVVVDNTFWFYQPEDEQATIDTFKAVALSDLPIAFLMGLGDLSRDFDVDAACAGILDGSGEGEKVIVLVLREKQKAEGEAVSEENGAEPFEKVDGAEGIAGLVLAVSAETNVPLAAEVRHLGGNSTSVLLENLDTGTAPKDEIFRLSWPKSTDVIDRR
jgi:outer membrane lipoprotein-sorting protein